MKLKDIKDVLTFAAFRPEPDDSSAPWRRRFPNQKTLLLNIGRNRTSWRALGRNGKFFDGGSQAGDFKDLAPTLADEWRGLTDQGWCAVSLNSRYLISLETNLSRKKGAEDAIRGNPRLSLGSKVERGKRYALTHNPESISSILLSCDEELIKKIEATLKECGLSAGRISCGSYAMLRRLLESVNDGRKPENPNLTPPDSLYVVCCEGAVCALVQHGDQWVELRSRTDLYETSNTDPVLDILTPLRERRGSDGSAKIVFAADQPDTDLPAKLSARFTDSTITDLTIPDQLWATLADS
jgi:hypothetical protein